MVIASKFGPVITDGKMSFDASPAALHKTIDASLKRLGIDYMDVWVLRNPGFLKVEQVEEIMTTVKVRQPLLIEKRVCCTACTLLPCRHIDSCSLI